MEKDVLSEVIEVEKEIQRCLDEERRISRDRVQSIRIELEDQLTRDRVEMEALADRKLKEACLQAQTEGRLIVQSEEERASRLSLLLDPVLREIVVRHLHMILPER